MAGALQTRAGQDADLATVRAWASAAHPLAVASAATLHGEPDGHWLVVEDTGTAPARVLASLRVRTALGLDRPRHWYHVGQVVHAAPELGILHPLQTLQLGSDLTGCSELAEVCWAPDLDLTRSSQVLAQLLQAAFAFIVRERQHHAQRLIVELPGLRDAHGHFPFWEGLGRYFYDLAPAQALAQFGPEWLSHVAALLPRQPIYTAFLSPSAQAALGQADPAARVLFDLLWQAGLRYNAHITVGDGGPVFETTIDRLVEDTQPSGAWRRGQESNL